MASKKPAARQKTELEIMKEETAREIGVDLGSGGKGNVSARDAGRVGGQMVRKLIAKARQTLTDENKLS